jgi:hypothetical protein
MINVTIGESKPQEKPFPKLMIATKGAWKGLVCFFEEPEKGFLINGKSSLTIGYADNFIMEQFVDFNEPITLQNA